jgi:ubiquinone/menaquinone biosynthesis C-methylase UbiE
MKTNNVHRMLELGAGRIFFASNRITVEALDYSTVTIELSDKTATERRLPIKPRLFDVKGPLPFQDNFFDGAYSHMLLNMRFSIEEIHFILSEIRRVLKPRGLHFFLSEIKMITPTVKG